MTEDEAGWVRANVWTPTMRKTHRDVPQAAVTCSCQGGMSLRCRDRNEHSLCHVGGSGLPSCETYITNKVEQVMNFREEYEHPTLSATGARRVTYAQVWLADRVCRWTCPCDCGHGRQVPALEYSDAPPEEVEVDVIELRTRQRFGCNGTVSRARTTTRDSVSYLIGDNQETLF